MISNFGRVKSKDRYEDFRGSKRFRKGRPMKTRVLRKYESVGLKQDNRSTTFRVHRLVAEHFCKRKNGQDIVNHIDQNRLNNVYTNLEWCTQKENIHHAMKSETWTRGENHGCSKLTAEQVKYIRTCGIGGYVLSKQMRVSYANIKRIRSYKIWKHI